MDQRERDLLEKYAPINEEVRTLQGEHALYGKQIDKLESKPYRTPAEDIQMKQLKKQKLESKTKLVAVLEQCVREDT